MQYKVTACGISRKLECVLSENLKSVAEVKSAIYAFACSSTQEDYRKINKPDEKAFFEQNFSEIYHSEGHTNKLEGFPKIVVTVAPDVGYVIELTAGLPDGWEKKSRNLFDHIDGEAFKSEWDTQVLGSQISSQAKGSSRETGNELSNTAGVNLDTKSISAQIEQSPKPILIPWPKRIATFFLNPLTYLFPAIITSSSFMIAWSYTDTALLANIGVSIMGAGMLLAATSLMVVLLYSLSKVLTCQSDAPISNYLAERSKWKLASTVMGLALFLTILMLALTVFSANIPFVDNLFTQMFQGINIGLVELAKLTGLNFLTSPELVAPLAAVIKLLFALSPAMTLDAVGRFATPKMDEDPDADLHKPDKLAAGWGDSDLTLEGEPVGRGCCGSFYSSVPQNSGVELDADKINDKAHLLKSFE